MSKFIRIRKREGSEFLLNIGSITAIHRATGKVYIGSHNFYVTDESMRRILREIDIVG